MIDGKIAMNNLRVPATAYIITGFHPSDSWASEKERFIGKKIVSRDMRPSVEPGYLAGVCHVDGEPMQRFFHAVKLEEVRE